MSQFRKPKAEMMEDLRERFRREGTIRIKETTPKFGGVRNRDVQQLVEEGLVEWIVIGRTARLIGEFSAEEMARQNDPVETEKSNRGN